MLGEGAQSLPDGRVLWVDVEAGRVFGLTGNHSELLATFPHEVSRVLQAEQGFLALGHLGPIALDQDFAVVGGCEILEPGSRLRLSDGAVLPDGSLVFGVLERSLASGMGSLLHLTTELELRTIVSGASIPNGVSMLPGRDRLVWVDSPDRKVLAFDWNAEESRLGAAEELFEIPDEYGIPDGLCVDAAGGIWLAMWDGASVIRLSSDGAVDTVVEVEAPNITSCAFDGQNRLIITTARVALSETEKSRYPGAGGLWVVSPEEHGQSGQLAQIAKMNGLFGTTVAKSHRRT